jgi:hypothetical protein
MTNGMAISAPNVYREHVSRYLPDVLCAAMKRYWQDGHESFMAERQQAPVKPDEFAPFTLTVAGICAKTDDTRASHDRPEYVKYVIASTDINDYGLSTVIPGYGNDQTAALMWYGCYDNGGRGCMATGANEAEKVGQLYDALCRHGEALHACASKPSMWAIDAGYMGQVVRRYADTAGAKLWGRGNVLLCRGFSGQGSRAGYKPGYKIIGAPREQCHLTEYPQIGRGLAFDSHYWHEVMQRAWLGDIGKPGSCSLFRGEHRDFATQIWVERLIGKGEVGGRMVWTFAEGRGRHDYGDAMAQAYAVAAYFGIGTGGQAAPVKPVSRRPRTGVTVIPM